MSSSVAAVPLKAGVDVGGWTLIKKLGQGTFSDVWSAKSNHLLLKGKTWALKMSVLHPQADGRGKVSAARLKKSRRGNTSKADVTTDESQRLFNEYQITALRIRPHASADVELARLFSLPPSACATGSGAGYQFLAMRDAGVDMMRLARPLNVKRYPTGAVCAVGVDILKALQLLHNKCSLVHMDVKPDNICLARPPAARNGARSKVPAGAALIDFTTTVPHSRADGSIPSTAEVGSHAYTSLRYFVSPNIVAAMDIEGLMYVLATLCGHFMPWMHGVTCLDDPDEIQRRYAGAVHGADSAQPLEYAAMALWHSSLPRCIAEAHITAERAGDRPDVEIYETLLSTLEAEADWDELARVLELYEGVKGSSADVDEELLAWMRDTPEAAKVTERAALAALHAAGGGRGGSPDKEAAVAERADEDDDDDEEAEEEEEEVAATASTSSSSSASQRQPARRSARAKAASTTPAKRSRGRSPVATPASSGEDEEDDVVEVRRSVRGSRAASSSSQARATRSKRSKKAAQEIDMVDSDDDDDDASPVSKPRRASRRVAGTGKASSPRLRRARRLK